MSLQLPIRRAMSSLQQVPMVPHAPLILIDFDQTITTHDTIGLLGQFGVSQTHNPKPWSYFVDSYLEEYSGHRDHLPDLPKGSNFTAFIQQLDSYKPIERASLARVSKHKVFGGLSRQAFIDEAKKLREKVLQPSVTSTLKQYKDNVRIVSLNWSKDWILGFTHELGLAREQIYSNDLTFVSDTCTGDIVPKILTTGDKQQIIKTFKNNKKVVYIGDSLGDIETLVESDMGIIIGKDSSLLKSLTDFGYTVQQDDILKPSRLYRVDTWDQIKQILDTHYPTL